MNRDGDLPVYVSIADAGLWMATGKMFPRNTIDPLVSLWPMDAPEFAKLTEELGNAEPHVMLPGMRFPRLVIAVRDEVEAGHLKSTPGQAIVQWVSEVEHQLWAKLAAMERGIKPIWARFMAGKLRLFAIGCPAGFTRQSGTVCSLNLNEYREADVLETAHHQPVIRRRHVTIAKDELLAIAGIADGETGEMSSSVVRNRRKPTRRAVTLDALASTFTVPPPEGKRLDIITRALEPWFKAHSHVLPSKRTLTRALEDFRKKGSAK